MKRIYDKNKALETVKQHSDTLLFLSIELRNDRDIAIQAVKQNWSALQYLSIELRNDREIALEAVKQHWSALRYLSDEYYENCEDYESLLKYFEIKDLNEKLQYDLKQKTVSIKKKINKV